MAIKALIERFKRTMRELRLANGANVTITFALSTIPIVGFVGAAVDYAHANSVKTALQAAADSTALMLSKTAATITTSALQTQANSYFKALFTRPEATGLAVNATFTNTNGNQVVVTATANVKTNFMNLMGFSTMQVAAELPGEVGQFPASRRAGARQHRLDGRRRQDAGADHRRQDAADAVAGGRRQQR